MLLFRLCLSLVLCLSLLSPALGLSQELAPDLPETLSFPAGFHWGTATASYQVEGGISNNWSAAGLDAGAAMQHFERYEADFGLAAEMGNSLYRLSLEWARIEPRPGEFDEAAIAHYREMLKSLQRKGIQPMVTLFHFTLPVWFEEAGGWTQPENIVHYTRYVERMARELGEHTYYWNTINEPLVYAFKSFDEGTWPPFKKDRNLSLRVVKHLILAHAEAYRIVHAQDPLASVGFAKNITLLQPNWPLNPLDQAMTSLQSYLFNEAFWEAIETGQLSFQVPGLEPIVIPYNANLKGSMDFIGVNYYTRYLITATGAQRTLPGVPVTELNWEIYPQGLLHVLRLANRHAQRLQIPIIITENGLADEHDGQRPTFLVQHLYAVWQAIQEGIPVRGYLHWSLLDNFEWADGFEAKFGLLDAQRQWRPSARLYQQISRDNGFSRALLQQHSLERLQTP